MISIIVCSIKPHLLEQLSASIAKSIGTEYEIVAHDNRRTNYSISKCYNLCAEKAHGEYLCFVHEDVLFNSNNWGKLLENKLKEPTTGVIGFAGSTIKTRSISGWGMPHQYNRVSFNEALDDEGNIYHKHLLNPENLDFSPVITLDGFCMVMRADVWSKYHFDEATFDGFHLYDLDITTAVITAGYKNYVCNRIEVIHISKGSFNNQWFKYCLLYHKKWSKNLPLTTSPLSQAEIALMENATLGKMTYFLLKRNVGSPKFHRERVNKFLYNNPLKFKSYYLQYRYLRYWVTNRLFYNHGV